jgi:Ca2+-binding EF-hand superfamily protein
MRVTKLGAVASIAGALVLAACSGRDKEPDAEQQAALANYVPPFVMSRLDFGGVVERRFRRLDVNNDDKLTRNEVSKRLAPRFDEIDRNKGGAISNEEWSAWMMQRFDAQDINHDGTVTSDERERAREMNDADLPTPAEEPANATAAGRG